jgi:hypothetical protein
MKELPPIKKKFWIFDATHIDCRELTEAERQKIKETERKYYENEQNGNLIL